MNLHLLDRLRRALANFGGRGRVPRHLIAAQYHRIYHYHIRKSAGTSLDAAFWRLAGITHAEFGRKSSITRNGLRFVRGDRKIIQSGQYFYASSHLPASNLTLPGRTFTITILRNPLDRLISYYRYLLWARDCDAAKEKEPFLEALQPEIARLGDSFVDFLDRTPRRDIMTQLYMFSDRFDVSDARDRILRCSIVGFTEQFAESLDRISGRLHLQLEHLNERRFKYPLAVSPEDLNKAREVLDPEFRLVEMIHMDSK